MQKKRGLRYEENVTAEVHILICGIVGTVCTEDPEISQGFVMCS